MRPATAALQAYLASWGPGATIPMADLYTFSLQGGETIRLSSAQCAVAAPAPNTAAPLFEFPLGPPIERSKISEKIGVEVGRIEIRLYAGSADLLALGGTLTWQEAVWSGLFDAAWCRVWRAYLDPSWTTAIGTISRFVGRVGNVEVGRTETRIDVNNLVDLLTIQMPRRLFQAACSHVFGETDANGNTVGMCGYQRYDGKNALGVSTGLGHVDVTAESGSDQNSIVTGFRPSVSTAYDNGSIIGLSGQNAGYTRTIGKLTDGTAYSLKPWVFPVIAGHATFRLLPGCDHTLATCSGTFNNKLRYGGDPDVPPPESAV